MSDPEYANLSDSEKLNVLVEKLKYRIGEYKNYNDCGMYYSNEEAERAASRKDTYETVGDDLEWDLRALGLL